MRLVTWNVNSLTARLPRVLDWIDGHQPDVLCLQETKQSDDAFPSVVFTELGYESAHHGDGRWNGVALISRVGLDGVVRGFRAAEDEYGCRIVAGTCAGVRVHSVYVPNGRSLDNEYYGFKLAWLARLRTMLDESYALGESVAVCGDFNVAPDDGDVWDPAFFAGLTHVSEPERQALRRVEEWGLEDVFRRFNEPGVFSWWDYRGGDFHQGRGVRMDLLLVSPDLAARARGSFVDRDARKGEKPSDHAPVVLDLEDAPAGSAP
jgi:exodeoxyribonuclease-3